jgi:luciferase family oxidoreductase group 1
VTAPRIPLSVLDLFPVGAGTPPSRAITESLEVARRVDDLGYCRYWIAEHHNMPSIASSAPEVLIGHVASITRRIRVGAGGIMLPNHSPLRVVEIFRTLEALHPGRIDLGLGRAPGTDPVTSAALRRRGGSGAEVNELLAEMLAFADGGFPEAHPFAGIEAMPSDVPLPPIWMLGSTTAGAQIAATLGVGFSFAGHFAMREAFDAVSVYRRLFQPSQRLAEPRFILAVNVVCGEDDAHAERLAAPLRLAFVRMATGRPGPIPSVEEAAAHRFTAAEEQAISRFAAGAVIGGPAKVRAGLEALVDRLRPEELMISTVTPVCAERIASYERLAELWMPGAAVTRGAA